MAEFVSDGEIDESLVIDIRRVTDSKAIPNFHQETRNAGGFDTVGGHGDITLLGNRQRIDWKLGDPVARYYFARMIFSALPQEFGTARHCHFFRLARFS